MPKLIRKKKPSGLWVRVTEDNSNTGFQITFDNGYTVSVGIGWGHYCSNMIDKDLNVGNPNYPDSDCCETAIIKPNGRFLKYKNGSVQSYQTTEELAETIAYTKSLEPNNYGRVSKKVNVVPIWL